MKKIVLASLLALSATAHAEAYFASGYTLGANIGQGFAKTNGQTKSNVFGRAYIGYNFSPYVSFNLGYVLLPTLKANGITLTNRGWMANLRVINPLSEGLSIYGQVGGDLLSATAKAGDQSNSNNATVLTYGGGLDYVFSNIGGLHLTLDYQRVSGHHSVDFAMPGYDLYSVGVYYQF